MKNRRNIIVAFLLCACLIVGVGYAALTDVMDVTGTTVYNEDNALDALIYFSEVDKSHEANNIQIVPGNVDKASFNVASLATVNTDYTFFWVTIKNDSSETAKVSFREYSGNSDTQYYEVSYRIASDKSTDPAAYQLVTLNETFTTPTNPDKPHGIYEIDPNGSTVLGIMVKLVGDSNGAMPTDKSVSASFSFEIDASAGTATATN